ncbi:ATP-grasp domain-containing protein [Myxococcus xanthus]|uniref:ATP-grasp domain-containing protein n=1 Tax=Myxococcus xanthus TaxID=34 RepID=UPI001125DC8C|nr:ATP-grasp domain-containing protein [Myxococcus xanthus]
MLSRTPRCAENSFCVSPLASNASATRNHSCFSTGFDICARVHGGDSPLNAPQHVVGRTLTIDSPFLTLDVAMLQDGGWAVVEVNDGGVSGLPPGLDPRTLFEALLDPR